MENERSNAPAVDRLSSLHDSILHHILSFLPTEESIGTCFLSKRFWGTWVFVPALKFVLNTPNDVNFVDQVIAHRSLSHIRTFSIVSEQNLGNNRVSSWVNYAVAHSVQEMEIHLNWETDLNILDHLYHCKTLESLSLWAVLEQPLRLPEPQTPCFTNLKILNLLLLNHYPGDSIGDLVSKCCKLEELRLGGVSFEALNISAPNLRKLELALLHCFEIQVSCPRLECLALRLHEELESFRGEMPSLHRVDIEMPPINSQSNLFWRQILKSVNHAAHLQFSYVDFKFCPGRLLDESDKHPTTFCHLKVLQFGVCLHNSNIEFIVNLLESAPNVEFIMMNIVPVCFCNDKNERWSARQLPSKVLHNMKVLKVFNDDQILVHNVAEFINFLSLNVSQCEEVVMVI